MSKYIGFLGSFLLLVACGSLRDKQLMEESSTIKEQIKQEIIEIEKKLVPLTNHANGINIQGRELTTKEIAITSRISGVEESFYSWKDEYQEVQRLLKSTPVSAENQLNGYLASQKQLNIITQRIEQLLNDI